MLPKWNRGQDSAVSIMTPYRLDSVGFECWWGDFPQLSTLAPTPTQPPVQWVPGVLPGIKQHWLGTDHMFPAIAKVNNGYSNTSAPPLSLHGML